MYEFPGSQYAHVHAMPSSNSQWGYLGGSATGHKVSTEGVQKAVCFKYTEVTQWLGLLPVLVAYHACFVVNVSLHAISGGGMQNYSFLDGAPVATSNALSGLCGCTSPPSPHYVDAP